MSTKARQSFAFVAAFVAGVQALAVSGQTTLSHSHRHAVLVLAFLAVLGAVATGVLAIVADGLRSFANLSSDDVLESANDSKRIGVPVKQDLCGLFARAVDERRNAVERRKPWLIATQISAVVTLVILSTELAYTLIVRLS